MGEGRVGTRFPSPEPPARQVLVCDESVTGSARGSRPCRWAFASPGGALCITSRRHCERSEAIQACVYDRLRNVDIASISSVASGLLRFARNDGQGLCKVSYGRALIAPYFVVICFE